MKSLAVKSLLFACSVVSSFGVVITFENGAVNASGIQVEPQFEWVYFQIPFPGYQTYMFQSIIDDFVDSNFGPTGGTANGQNGFDLFDPGGGGLDISLLSWRFAEGGNNLSLYTGPGSLTQAPTNTDPGAEDYRYDSQNGTAPSNLSFYYDGNLWATGYVTRFVVNIDNRLDFQATGWGNAVVTDFVAAGEDFFVELMALSAGTGELFFEVDEFNAIQHTNPGTFLSSGTIHVVPEPSTWASLLGGAVFAFTLIFRRRRNS